jgi:hypothetical protein
VSEDQPLSQKRRSRLSLRFALAIYAPTVALLALVGMVARPIGVEPGVFLRDPAHIAHVPFYTGIISNLGIAVWCAGAVMALFAAAALPKTPDRREDRRFLLWSGLLTLYLMVDDLAMLHDDVYRNLFHIYEQVVFLVYLPIAAIYLTRFRRQLFGPHVALVVLTGAFTILSLTMDQWHMLLTVFGRIIVPENQLVEKGAKLLSMVSWMAFLARTAADAVGTRDSRAPAADSVVSG